MKSQHVPSVITQEMSILFTHITDSVYFCICLEGLTDRKAGPTDNKFSTYVCVI